MNWIAIAIFAYFLVGLEVILDKFLLSSKRVSHPSVYTFYSGALSAMALLILAPFGFHLVKFNQAVPSLLAGLVFTYGVLCLFFALNVSEASKVTPVVGAVIPLATYFFSLFFLREGLTKHQLEGVALLILGGIFISIELPLKFKKKNFFAGFYYSVAAGILLAIAATAFKYFYSRDNFINVFIWTRLGLFVGALSLLLFSFWRKIILKSLRGFKDPQPENYKTGGLFVGNKILGGIGSILTQWSIALGSVTIVNALVSTEYAFIFLMGLVSSLWFPKIFREKKDWLHIAQEIISILIITAGIILISMTHWPRRH
jgi:drug/metabolite transporter (DMT)-like permease